MRKVLVSYQIGEILIRTLNYELVFVSVFCFASELHVCG